MIKVLAACRQPKKSADIQAMIGVRHRETFQRNYLDPLLHEGLLVRTIPNKPTSRLQQYRTTDKGQAMLAAAERHGE